MKIGMRSVGKVKIDPKENIFLDHVHLSNQDYSGQNLRSFCTVGTRLERCRFDNIRIKARVQFGSGREMSEFVDCTFDGAKLDMGGGLTRFVRCSFRNVNLHHWMTRAVELIDCVFSGKLHTAVFSGKVPEELQAYVKRERNEIRGNDFSGMALTDVGFRNGVDLSLQKLPTGPDYVYLPDAPCALQHAKGVLLGWSNLELRRIALQSLKSMEAEIGNGQKQLLLKISDFYLYQKPPREAVDTLVALLRGELAVLQ